MKLMLLLLLISQTVAMEWCEYFGKLGRYRPECGNYRTNLTTKKLNSIEEAIDEEEEERERTALLRLLKFAGSTQNF